MVEGIDQCQRKLDLWLLTPSRCWWNPQTESPAPHPAGPSAHLKPAPSSDAASVRSCYSPRRRKETGTSSHNLLIIPCPCSYQQDVRFPGISQRYIRAQAPVLVRTDKDTEPWTWALLQMCSSKRLSSCLFQEVRKLQLILLSSQLFLDFWICVIDDGQEHVLEDKAKMYVLTPRPTNSIEPTDPVNFLDTYSKGASVFYPSSVAH